MIAVEAIAFHSIAVFDEVSPRAGAGGLLTAGAGLLTASVATTMAIATAADNRVVRRV
jgi:hypothetical protein